MMKLLDKFRIKKCLDVLLATPEPGNPAQAQAIARLTQIGRPAIPYMLPALGHVPPSPVLLEFLTGRVDNVSLPDFVRGLTNRNPQVVAGVVTVLSRSRRYDPHHLLVMLGDPALPKAALLQILTAHKDTLRPKTVLEHWHSTHKEVRATVGRLVEQVASEAMIPALLTYADSDDWQMRMQVARILGRFPSAAGSAALLRLATDAHKSVRLVALESLIRAPRLVDVGPLCALLRDPDLSVQSKVIETLIQLNHPHTLRPILDILQDESEYVRRAAVEVLNAVGTTEAIKDLLGALGDDDWWVRVRAADALGTIGGSKVVEAVLPLLQDAEAFIRRCAIEILNTTHDPQAFGALVSALGDTDWWVQERAVDALAALGDRRAVPALITALRQATPAAPAVLRALARLGDPQAIPAVLEVLPQAQPALQKEALQTLAVVTDTAHAPLVQEAVLQVIRGASGENKSVAESVWRRLVAQYGEKPRSAPNAASTAAGRGSLLNDSDGYVRPIMPRAPTFYATTKLEEEADSGAPRSPEVLRLEPDTLLAGRYRVVRQVGRGGFGTAVLVEDLVVNEEIILKFLHPALAADERIIKSFIRELRYARKITHENVIRIYDFLSVGEAYAISMEYFPSHTLATEALPLALPRGLAIMEAICRGMSVAHHANIVHRDLKPQNLLINADDLVKIVDFGLAAGVSSTDSRLTQRSAHMGTPTYMAPEQARGGVIDTRTDIYSLGVIMYEFFTGHPPYQGQTPLEIVFQHVEGKPRPPRQLAPALPEALEAVILQAMAVSPEERFQQVDTLREALAVLATSS
ncbi:MAG: HEAT repeat domain-containing protein [Candidatus Tectimicrobiota bacterium]